MLWQPAGCRDSPALQRLHKNPATHRAVRRPPAAARSRVRSCIGSSTPCLANGRRRSAVSALAAAPDPLREERFDAALISYGSIRNRRTARESNPSNDARVRVRAPHPGVVVRCRRATRPAAPGLGCRRWWTARGSSSAIMIRWSTSERSTRRSARRPCRRRVSMSGPRTTGGGTSAWKTVCGAPYSGYRSRWRPVRA